MVCSVAIAFGALGALALLKGLRRRHFLRSGPWAYAACGPSFGPGFAPWGAGPDGWRGRGFRRGWRGGLGRSFWLRSLFARLDTTPGQEREIRAAFEDLQKTAWEAKSGVSGARTNLADAIRGESFDEAALGEAQGRADATLSQVREAFAAALRRIHGVLDSHQRERLADFLAKGPGFRERAPETPYRD